MIMEVIFEKVSVGHQHLHHGLGEPLHVPVPDGRVLTLQLLQNFKTLCQLREHIHN